MFSGSILLTFVIGALLMIVLAGTIILSFVRFKQNLIAHTLEKAALQHTFENQLLQSRLETQEQSFQYFSEEIHDNVGQVLSVVGMHLYQLEEECSGERAVTLARQGSELLNKAIADLRSISHTFNANYLTTAGIIETLRQEIAYINSVKGPLCSLKIAGDPEELSPDRQTLLFRIVQEAINNALKHAHATEIAISLQYSDHKLVASVSDDGPGLGERAVKGLGITNMQIRAGLLGGNLWIDSPPGCGTTLSIAINLYPE